MFDYLKVWIFTLFPAWLTEMYLDFEFYVRLTEGGEIKVSKNITFTQKDILRIFNKIFFFDWCKLSMQ